MSAPPGFPEFVGEFLDARRAVGGQLAASPLSTAVMSEQHLNELTALLLLVCQLDEMNDQLTEINAQLGALS
jgi:hypothetical protein